MHTKPSHPTRAFFRSPRFVRPIFALLLAAAIPASGQSLNNLHTYASWPKGWREIASAPIDHTLRIEATRYDFALNLADFSKSRFRVRTDQAGGYFAALSRDARDLTLTSDAVFTAEIDLVTSAPGVTPQTRKLYRANSCKAGLNTPTDTEVPLRHAWLWESGRYVQHYEMKDLYFEDTTPTTTPPLKLGVSSSSLRVVAWPDSLTLTVAVTPAADIPAGSTFHASLKSTAEGVNLGITETISANWPAGTTRQLRLNHVASTDNRSTANLTVSATMNGYATVYPGAYSSEKDCFVTLIQRLDSSGNRVQLIRPFATGAELKNYDDIIVTVQNLGETAQNVPYLLDLRSPANITGHVPIVCDLNGTPLGIPIQLSKNWHYTPMSYYLMAYAYLPVGAKQTKQYLIRIPYGYYGTVPVASHAQLSLVGYGLKENIDRNGRWDQLAIGCWGETMTFDVDMSLTNVAIADVRHLTAKRGPKESPWKWSSAGWGGDWLGFNNATNAKVPFGYLKTAYIAHGPCLTEARYKGVYGTNNEVGIDAKVRTLRTNDYARTFFTLEYTFNTTVPAAGVWFFRLGSSWDFITSRLAYGDGNGLIAEVPVPVRTPVNGKLDTGGAFTNRPAPWWVHLPDADSANAVDTVLDPNDSGSAAGRRTSGDRAIIVRSYSARFGTQTVTTPTLTAQNFRTAAASADGRGAHINALLVPPAGVTEIKAGDYVKLEVEFITLPRAAEDYYGDNEAFKAHLRANPSSWTTVYREAVGNNLAVTVTSGGALQESYPIVVKANTGATSVTVSIGGGGGVGYVPIRFENLGFSSGWRLVELVNGVAVPVDQSLPAGSNGVDLYQNDFWQLDVTDEPGVYNLVFNVPADGKATSTWRLER